MKRAYLLTGQPGTGKTSIIKEAIAGMKGRAGGFYTEDIRNKGARQGFRLVTLDGQDAILSHVDIRSPHRVSRYGVDIGSLERVGVSALREAPRRSDLIVIDEIGKMEMLSASFRETVPEIISSGKKVLGTIMLSRDPFADAIKRRPEVKLITVTRDNRRQALEEVRRWLETEWEN